MLRYITVLFTYYVNVSQCCKLNNNVSCCNCDFSGDSVEVAPPAVLATNGTSGLSITCTAPSFPDGDYYWILVDDDMNSTVATGGVLEFQQLVFEGAEQGARYQCIVETLFGNIFSDIVEVVGEKMKSFAECLLLCILHIHAYSVSRRRSNC